MPNALILSMTTWWASVSGGPICRLTLRSPPMTIKAVRSRPVSRIGVRSDSIRWTVVTA